MNIENDWILPKIKKIIKERQTKIVHIAKSIGISNGEFSKILNGERLNYYKHIPAIADYFNLSFLELVKNDLPNHFNTPTSENSEVFLIDNYITQCKETISSKDANIKTLDDLVKSEREAKENYKRKYENCKEKLKLAEGKNLK
jgi:transcriptional regulator with XRE-family HTH domain